jgi:uncharacterized protein YciI
MIASMRFSIAAIEPSCPEPVVHDFSPAKRLITPHFYRQPKREASGFRTPPGIICRLNNLIPKGEVPMWYIVMSRSLPEKEAHKQLNYEAHRQWLDDQHRAGRLLFSGPTSDGAYGIYIMLAASLDEAKSIAAQDPHHALGIRQMEVLEWRAHRAFRLEGPSIAEVEKLSQSQ